MIHNIVSIAVPCVTRAGITLNDTVTNIMRGGFSYLHLSMEPGFDNQDLARLKNTTPDIAHAHQHKFTLGHLTNFMYCWKWLLETTDTEYLMVVENDVRFCPSAASKLLQVIEREKGKPLGLISMFTPDTHVYEAIKTTPALDGWVDIRPGILASAGQCICMRRTVVEQLFTRNDFLAIDWFINEFCKQNQLPVWQAIPSLADHIATHSAVRREHWPCHRGLQYNDEG